jgi:hypothetical protein
LALSIDENNINMINYPYLLDLNKTQIKTQITQTQNRLNQELNQHNKIFAYPYGEASLEIFKQVWIGTFYHGLIGIISR